MPRMKELHDHLSSPEGEEERHSYLIDVPPGDWTTDILIDLHPDEFVQLKKGEDGKWSLATTLESVKSVPKKVKRARS